MEVLRVYYWLIILNATFFALNVYLFIFLLREFSKLIKKLRDIELGPEESLNHIQKEAEDTIEKIKKSTQNIIDSIELYKGDAEQVFKDKYSENMRTMTEKVAHTIDSSTQEVITTFNKNNETLTSHLRNEYDLILNKLTSEILVTEKVFAEDFVKRKQKIELEIEKYEKLRKQEIEASIVELVYQVAHKTIPDLVPQKQHEAIIMKELADALEAGRFSLSSFNRKNE